MWGFLAVSRSLLLYYRIERLIEGLSQGLKARAREKGRHLGLKHFKNIFQCFVIISSKASYSFKFIFSKKKILFCSLDPLENSFYIFIIYSYFLKVFFFNKKKFYFNLFRFKRPMRTDFSAFITSFFLIQKILKCMNENPDQNHRCDDARSEVVY